LISTNIDAVKAQKLKNQSMSSLIFHSVQQGCAFVPRTSTPSKPALLKPSFFAPEALNESTPVNDLSVRDISGSAPSGRPSSAKKISSHELSSAKTSEPRSELVAAICSVRYRSQRHHAF
jgi:hypothetical protein